MRKECIYSLKAPYRDEMHVTGYYFGKGEKAAAIVGAFRGNEVQQLYICSQLIKRLRELEERGAIVANKEILVIPSVNHYSMNIEKRFWAVDNTDINRMFPGDVKGETTKRIAAGVFDTIKGYSYGIQFASFYMPGDFIPHVRMMETGFQNTSLANLFGLPYVVVRKPNPLDTSTLNYNWQQFETSAFSVYTNETDFIDEESASQGVSAVLRFLTRMGIIRYNCHNGFIASVVEEDELTTVQAPEAGIYRRLLFPGQEVRRGEVIAEILDPYEGEVKMQVLSPTDGIIFFSHKKPLVIKQDIVCRIIRRMHE
ncbi:MAG: M14 family metallopeptidase [Lachnospiraceae bacterium]